MAGRGFCTSWTGSPVYRSPRRLWTDCANSSWDTSDLWSGVLCPPDEVSASGVCDCDCDKDEAVPGVKPTRFRLEAMSSSCSCGCGAEESKGRSGDVFPGWTIAGYSCARPCKNPTPPGVTRRAALLECPEPRAALGLQPNLAGKQARGSPKGG